ncbi:MAG: DNA mismatch repair endonuclease MutL [Bacteroidetes bacterium]|nr:MAG: DNA mismatch repair endonuclease MutL [Bacteroidota bacterium]TAG89978.1 MAG: DNA mismatch repair endonuclease MutL [Bacteroidota bacterium]
MQDIIQLLPDALANQIAAGEVVQRPASIVKELLENAIDAKSSEIKLVIKDAGKILVQVIDNGSGMSETDARMCFERHATSKIKTTDDLFAITTMGFRGEALASIAAVAQVELKSKRANDSIGTQILIEGSKIKSQEVVSAPTGTSIAVKNVFFNVPARRNFLKSNAIEMKHILDEFQRVALAHPEIEFSLFHNDTEIYQLLAGKLSQRIVGTFGKNYQKILAPCQEDTTFLKIQGYIGKPENAKKTRGEQFFFVNKRFIKHNYLHNAVVRAFEGLIPNDCFPFYVLFLEINPNEIDINIHPTKTEIKFIDERMVYSLIQSAVKKSLSINHFAPSIDFNVDVNFKFDNELSRKAIQENPLQDRGSSFSMPKQTTREKNNQDNWQDLYKVLADKTNEGEETKWHINQETGEMRIASKINQIVPKQSNLFENEDWKNTDRPVFQILNQYIATPAKSGLLLIHQKYAQERLFYDKFLHISEQNNATSQRLLFPILIEFNPKDWVVFQEIKTEITNLGFVFDYSLTKPKKTQENQQTNQETDQENTKKLMIISVPSDLIDQNEKEILEEIIEQYQNSNLQITIDRRKKIIGLFSKRLASKKKTYLNKEEMHNLIDKLFACSNPNYTHDGQTIITLINANDLASFFSQARLQF